MPPVEGGVAVDVYKRQASRVDTTRLLFLDSEQSLPVVDRLTCAADAGDFIRICLLYTSFDCKPRLARLSYSPMPSSMMGLPRNWRTGLP